MKDGQGCCGSSCGCHDNPNVAKLERLFQVRDAVKILVDLGWSISGGDIELTPELESIENQIKELTEGVI